MTSKIQPQYASSFQASTLLVLANVSLTKASCMARPGSLWEDVIPLMDTGWWDWLGSITVQICHTIFKVLVLL